MKMIEERRKCRKKKRKWKSTHVPREDTDKVLNGGRMEEKLFVVDGVSELRLFRCSSGRIDLLNGEGGRE